MDKVTAIIPMYNRVELTLRAIGSVLGQTYPSIETIVVDDGSEENTKRIADLVHSIDKGRMLVCHQVHRGPASARNTGLEMVTPDTRYIAFLDSDDYWAANKIQQQVAAMGKHLEAVLCHTSYLREVGGAIINLSHAGAFEGKVFPKLLFNCPITTSSVMLRRDKMRKFRFRTDMECVEDIVAWTEISKLGPVVGIDDVLTTITQNENSGSTNKAKQIRGINNLIEYIKGDCDIGWITRFRLLRHWDRIRRVDEH